MNVPNHERKAFRDMTPEERSAIVEAWISSAGCEVLRKGIAWERSDSVDFMLDADGVYRTRQRQLVIPWEHIKPEYKWAAMDMDGSVRFHKSKPSMDSRWWHSGVVQGAPVLDINTTGIDWRESLTARPEGV